MKTKLGLKEGVRDSLGASEFNYLSDKRLKKSDLPFGYGPSGFHM